MLVPDVGGGFVADQHLAHHALRVGQVRGQGGGDEGVAGQGVEQLVKARVGGGQRPFDVLVTPPSASTQAQFRLTRCPERAADGLHPFA